MNKCGTLLAENEGFCHGNSLLTNNETNSAYTAYSAQLKHLRRSRFWSLLLFQLEELQIAPSTSEGAPDYVREDCCPGAPYITFRAPPPGLSLTFINSQALSGHITHWLTVRNGDTISKLATAVARQDKTIKGETKKDARVRIVKPCHHYYGMGGLLPEYKTEFCKNLFERKCIKIILWANQNMTACRMENSQLLQLNSYKREIINSYINA